MLAYDQGASDLLCNNPNEKRLIEDFCALVTGDLTEGDKLEGYSGKLFNEIGAEAYPVIAFRTWFRRRRANNDHFVDWNEGHGRYFEQNARAFELQQTISSNEVSDAVDTVETAPDLDNMPSSLKEGIEPPLCDDVPTNEGDNKTKDYGVRFTVQQAVIQMFQLTNIELDPCFGFMLDGVAGACESEMLKDMDRQSESVSFMGYEYVNPFNVMSNNEATFPREAFYEWWKANPHRIPCPEWFEDLRKADGVSQSVLTGNCCDEDVVVVDGITVKDLRDMLDADSPFYTPRILALLRTRKALIPKEVKDEKGFSELNTFEKKEQACSKEAEKQLEHLGIVKPNENTPKTELNSIARVICGIKSGDHGGGRPSLSKKKP